MVKSELITKIAEKHPDIDKEDAEQAVAIITATMADNLSNKGRVEIRGFGSFNVHFYPARDARNPKTGEQVITTDTYTPHFKPGKELRAVVNASVNPST